MGDEDEEKVEEVKEEKGVLKNTGILNLKDFTEEDLVELKEIKNIGILVVPKKLAGKILGMAKNTGIVVFYTEGSKLYMGKTMLDAETLKNFDEAVDIIQVGKLVVENDVTAELIRQKIKSIRNYGKVDVPRNVYGVLMTKVMENAGTIEKIE